MKISRAVLACFLCLAGAACKDDDKNSEEDRCVALIETACAHGMDCLASENLIAENQRDEEYDTCVSDASKELNCSRVKDVTSAYPECIDDIQELACDQLVATVQSGQDWLPDSCFGVLEY
jgi:hypothetical protein